MSPKSATASNNVYSIVTFHDDALAQQAADAWRREGVAAIGWGGYRDFRKKRQDLLDQWPAGARYRQLFLQIKKGDCILAYAKNNMVAYAGTVTKPYCGPLPTNEVAREPFGYEHMIGVRWWPQPHHFLRTDLPPFFAKQLGLRGAWVTRLDLGGYGFDKTIKIIRECGMSKSALQEFEDLIKAGLRKYLPGRIDTLESGLRLIQAEATISESDRPDFRAVDAKGNPVLIECKGTAESCGQLVRYGKNSSGKKPRLMLLAFATTPECRKEAKRNSVELIECGLTFQRML